MNFRWCLFLLLLLSACGYHVPGRGGGLPGGIERVYVEPFVNQTSEPQLENRLTNDISAVLARNTAISLVESDTAAQAILRGTLLRYRSRALSYDKNDDISEYRATLVITAELKQPAPERNLLWRRTLNWSVDYAAADAKQLQEDLESLAQEELSQRLAEELYFQLLDDF